MARASPVHAGLLAAARWVIAERISSQEWT
jgi:hypothetical protein